MDAAYRSDLRNLNESNFARFDAKLEQRFAESALATDRRFAESAATLEQRLSKFARAIEERIVNRFAVDLKNLEVSLMHQQAVQMRWMIGIWAAVFLAVIGFRVRR